MNKIRENLNRFLTCTAYRNGKPVCTFWSYRDDLDELIARKEKTGDVS